MLRRATAKQREVHDTHVWLLQTLTESLHAVRDLHGQNRHLSFVLLVYNKALLGLLASLLGAKILLGAPGLTTSIY